MKLRTGCLLWLLLLLIFSGIIWVCDWIYAFFHLLISVL